MGVATVGGGAEGTCHPTQKFGWTFSQKSQICKGKILIFNKKKDFFQYSQNKVGDIRGEIRI